MKGVVLAAAGCSVLAANPTVTLNNAVEMPLLALGTWQYDNATAEDAIKLADSGGDGEVDYDEFIQFVLSD